MIINKSKNLALLIRNIIINISYESLPVFKAGVLMGGSLKAKA